MAKAPPLVIEKLEEPQNLQFLTLVEYKRNKYLTIIENVVEDEIQAYLLDQLSAEGIDQDWFMSVATLWFYGASERYPLSFEFAKMGKADVVRKVLKTFNMNSTSRVIGKLFTYPINVKPKIKRRKVNFVDELPSVVFKKDQ